MQPPGCREPVLKRFIASFNEPCAEIGLCRQVRLSRNFIRRGFLSAIFVRRLRLPLSHAFKQPCNCAPARGKDSAIERLAGPCPRSVFARLNQKTTLAAAI
jgi:hypothetical protein